MYWTLGDWVVGFLVSLAIVLAMVAASPKKPEPPLVPTLRVGFLGNSIQYYNDLPRVMERLMDMSGMALVHEACFRGGASLASLLRRGNGMRGKMKWPDVGPDTVVELFKTKRPQFVVLNDYTQAPARAESRDASIQTLVESYAPLLRASGATPILLSTYSYRAHAKGSDDVGSIPDEFTAKLDAGYDAYAAALKAVLPTKLAPRVARVGQAFLTVHRERPDLWRDLFFVDDFHPSPAGTFLQACVLYCLLCDLPPPLPASEDDVNSLWRNARYMQPDGPEPSRLPTPTECAYLRDVAIRLVLPEDQRSERGV